MSHSIHFNQLSAVLAEHQEGVNNRDNRKIGRAMRFLEGVQYEEDSLRVRRWRRTHRVEE